MSAGPTNIRGKELRILLIQNLQRDYHPQRKLKRRGVPKLKEKLKINFVLGGDL